MDVFPTPFGDIEDRLHPATRMITLVDTYVTLHTALGGRGLLTREGINARLAERGKRGYPVPL